MTTENQSQPLPDKRLEPERIWVTRYADGRMSESWLPELRQYDPERDIQLLSSVEYVRADLLQQSIRVCTKCGAELKDAGEQVWRCPNADAENTDHHTVLQVVEVAATGADIKQTTHPKI